MDRAEKEHRRDMHLLRISKMFSEFSTCLSRKVGCIIASEAGHIISTGYNGTPRGTRNCNEGGCPRCNSFSKGGTDLGECLCSHGEENAITQAAYHGVRVPGGIIYTTFSPCLMCTKMIINAGLDEVVYNAAYPLGDISIDLLTEAGVKPKGTAVIGTVQGDLHDIGKNLVALMLESSGFNVIDVGVNVPVDKFVEKAGEHSADVVGISSLLTTGDPHVKATVEALKVAAAVLDR